MSEYQDFLEAKISLAPKTGFVLDPSKVHPLLKPHQRDVVVWNCLGGCRADFLSFGLGKTMIQLETCRQVIAERGGQALIVCPLGVKHEFVRDGLKIGIDRIKYITNTEVTQLEDGCDFYITNYERIRRGSIDAALFSVVSFDEASILRSLDTETTQTILETFQAVPFRFVCTATPSPNRFLELINYAEYLGIMDRGQALTRFFERDSTTAGNLTIYERRAKEFWHWMSSWACFITSPSDLGYDATGYDLPDLEIIPHRISFERPVKVDKKTGQASLLSDSSKSLSDAAKEKRDSLNNRVAEVQRILYNCIKSLNYASDNRGAQRVPERVLREEQRGLVSQATGEEPSGLSEEQSGLYSAEQEVEGGKPGTDEGVAKQKKRNPRKSGIQETVLSTEQSQGGGRPQSLSIADQIQSNDRGLQHNVGSSVGPLLNLPANTPGINPKEKRKFSGRSLPQIGEGEGFALSSLQRGFGPVSGRRDGAATGNRLPGQLLIWCDLNSEQKAIEVVLKEYKISYVSLYGSEDADKRELEIERWKDNEVDVFLSKPAMYGQGLNMQQASLMIFAGITYKFQEFIQGIHRIYRFGQEQACQVHIIYTDAEDEIYRTLTQKWANHRTLQSEMTAIIKAHGLNSDLSTTELKREMFTGRQVAYGQNWTSVNNDCVAEWQTLESDSLDLIVTSIPFGNHYEYSENYNCFGHNETNEKFFEQMDFLVPELYRTLKPGRIACIHVKDRIRYSYMNGTGFSSIDPFSDDTTRAFRKWGFHLMTRITVDTDVVRENASTYRLGWSEACKDMTKMGAGLPEYVLVLRKAPTTSNNAYSDEPVIHDKREWIKKKREWSSTYHEGYSRGRWQLDAHAHWKTSGARLLSMVQLRKMAPKDVLKYWKAIEAEGRYDYHRHAELCEMLDELGRLPSGFMMAPPQSNCDDIWDDVTRMRTLNSAQVNNDNEKHICPLQLDIIERCIERYSNAGELVADPFHGIGSVGHQAVKMKRRAFGTELNSEYWADGLKHLRGAELQQNTLTLFDDQPEPATVAA